MHDILLRVNEAMLLLLLSGIFKWLITTATFYV